MAVKKKRKTYMMPVRAAAVLCVLLAAFIYWHISSKVELPAGETGGISQSIVQKAPETIPEFSRDDFIILNGGVPEFTEYDMENMIGEVYPELDALGRCGTVYARIDRTMMPQEERGEIGMVRPSGWHTVKYPELIADKYLYNRCHLIAYAMTGQNANELNLITGTRYFNKEGMLPFEKQVLEYLDDTDNHVLYRVSPLFIGKELVARGVEIEAYSVEDRGRGICLHVFIYNHQPGIEIDYRSGDSRAATQRSVITPEMAVEMPRYRTDSGYYDSQYWAQHESTGKTEK